MVRSSRKMGRPAGAGSPAWALVALLLAVFLAGVLVGRMARLERVRSLRSRRGSGPGDDLTRIRGIGPRLAARLNDAGVTTYRQIAQWADGDTEGVAASLGAFRGRIERDGWVDEARREHERKYGESLA